MNARLAAGVGVVSVFVLLGGSSAAVAYAGPGDSRDSDRGHSSDRGGGGSNKGKPDDDRRGYDNGNRDANSNRGGGTVKSNRSAPESRVGSGRDDDGPQLSSSSRSAATSHPDSGTRSTAPNTSASRSAAGTESSAGEAPLGKVPAPSTADAAGSTGGSDSSSAPVHAFEPPQVTVGNGRRPATKTGGPERHRQDPAPAPVAPAPPPRLPPPPPRSAPVPLHPVDKPPAVIRQFVVAPGVGSTDPLWGIAGLLLIPVAGAALGYRQARGAQAAERIHRS